MSVLVTVGVLVLVAVWAMASYNKLVRLRTQVTRNWRLVDAERKRRHDLVLKLLDEVKHADLDRETWEALGAARHRAIGVNGPADAGRKEAELSSALARAIDAVGRHAQLTARVHVETLQEEVTSAESRIGGARHSYNAVAAAYNAAAEVIPGNVVAGLAGFRPAELFQAPTDGGPGSTAASPPNN
jgi:LemA protein